MRDSRNQKLQGHLCVCACVCICVCVRVWPYGAVVTRALVRVCVCVYMCVCVRVWPYGAVVCAVDFQLKHCGFDPRRVRFHTSFFSFSISGWLPTAKCVFLSTCGGKKKKKKEKKKRNSHWPKPATESRVV